MNRERRADHEAIRDADLDPALLAEYEARIAAGADPHAVYAELRARPARARRRRRTAPGKVSRAERLPARGRRQIAAAGGARPADDGARLAADGARPAADGARLADDGARLADDGARLAARGARPADAEGGARPADAEGGARPADAEGGARPADAAGMIAREADGDTVDPDAARRIAAARTGGRPLDAQLRRQLERALGYDLDHVRVHTGDAADAAARAVSARAFALGADLFFRAGAYDPGSQRGVRLIAHEVAHAVQAGRGELPAAAGLAISAPGDAHERAADRFADEVVARRAAGSDPAAAAAALAPGSAAPALRREELSDEELRELRELNGRAMGGLLTGVEGLGGQKRARYYSQLDTAGIDVKRMRVAFRAVGALNAGKTARDFAFEDEDMYAMCRSLGFRDQRDAVFQFVEPGFTAPKQREPGSTVNFKDGRQGIVHRGYVKRQAGKHQLPWMCNNPGAVGNGPSFKSPSTYPGKSIGPAAINIYPSEADGMAGLVAWIEFQGRVNKMSFGGFFRAHAPADDGKAGNKGNDPEAYFRRVAGQMGLDPRTARGTPIASMDASKIAAAIRAVGEGYELGGDVLIWPYDDKELDREVWFAMMYWEDKAAP